MSYDCQRPEAREYDHPRRCQHEACRPQGRISDELNRMYREKSEGPQSIEHAAQFLVEAAGRIDALNEEIALNELKQKESAKRQVEMREEISALNAKADDAITAIAMSFGHTRVYTLDPEESHG